MILLGFVQPKLLVNSRDFRDSKRIEARFFLEHGSLLHQQHCYLLCVQLVKPQRRMGF